jgi:hypothetical protein
MDEVPTPLIAQLDTTAIAQLAAAHMFPSLRNRHGPPSLNGQIQVAIRLQVSCDQCATRSVRARVGRSAILPGTIVLLYSRHEKMHHFDSRAALGRRGPR